MAFHIIGDADTVLGYRFAGVTGDAVSTVEEARSAFQKAIAGGQGILLITEQVENMLDAEVKAHRLATCPPFLAVVPGVWGTTGKRRSLQSLISEAVGIKIVETKPQDNM